MSTVQVAATYPFSLSFIRAKKKNRIGSDAIRLDSQMLPVPDRNFVARGSCRSPSGRYDAVLSLALLAGHIICKIGPAKLRL